MATEYIPSSGGLSTDCNLFLSNGNLVNITQLQPGDLLLSADGKASEVEHVVQFIGDLVRITQKFKHVKEGLPNGYVPCGGMAITVSATQELLLRTAQRVKRVTKKDGESGSEKRVIEITQLRSIFYKGFGKLVRPITSSKSFTVTSPIFSTIAEMKAHTKKATSSSDDGYYYWKCRVKNLQEPQLNKELRGSTKVLLSPINLEIPVLKEWMNKWFNEEVTSGKVEAMAWLLGFWIGDGYRRGAVFALHSEDHDVNEYLRMAAEKLGMTLTIKVRNEVGFKADGYLHTQTGSRDRNSPLTSALKELKFYQNGRINGPKCVPAFLRFETRSVKEFFMAGLIDSDGCTNTIEGTARVAIKTVFEPIKDGIFIIVRSLGLNLTVSFDPEQIREDGLHQNDTWIFHLFEGANKSVFWSILNKCSCERKRQPRELKNCRIPLYPPTEIEESDTVRLNVIPMAFDIQKSGTGRLFAVYLKNPSSTFITEEQLICSSASLDIVRHEVSVIVRDKSYFKDEKNFCYSCARAKDSRFEQIPWDTAQLWCRNCRKRHQETAIFCLNDSCREIPSKDQAKQMRKAGKLCCHSCGSEVRNDFVKKRSWASGECVSCDVLESSDWLKLPWNKEANERLCRQCYYSHTVNGKYCVSCCKVFTASELKELLIEYTENNELDGSWIPCARCKKSTNISLPRNDGLML